MDWKRLFIRILGFIKKQKATTVVIATLVAIVFLQRMCSTPGVVTEYKDKLIYKDTIMYEYDTVETTTIKTIFVSDTIIETDTIYHDIDTAAILSAYYATKLFTDTLSNDKELFAVSRYKVSQNELERRDFTYSIKRPTSIINHTEVINPPKNKLFLDLSIGGNAGMFSAPIGLSFVTKTDKVYSMKYDPINKLYYVGMSFKIFQHGNTK